MSVGTPSVSSLTGLQANKRKWPEKVNNKWVKQTISVSILCVCKLSSKCRGSKE